MNERRFGRALLQQLGRWSVDIHMTETAFLMALDVDDTHSYFRISIFPCFWWTTKSIESFTFNYECPATSHLSILFSCSRQRVDWIGRFKTLRTVRCRLRSTAMLRGSGCCIGDTLIVMRPATWWSAVGIDTWLSLSSEIHTNTSAKYLPLKCAWDKPSYTHPHAQQQL